MFINEKQIRKLIRLVEESSIGSIELSSWGRRVRITKTGVASSNGHSDASSVVVAAAPPSPAPVAASPATAVEAPPEDTSKYVEIRSPMVGTFYSAPSPEANAYVSLNEKVTAGQVVCIVEAMKLMNEIEAEVSGRVVKIIGQNAKPVEFDQVLFLIDPAG